MRHALTFGDGKGIICSSSLCGRPVIGGFANLRHRDVNLIFDKLEQHRECSSDPSGLVIFFDSLGRETLGHTKKAMPLGSLNPLLDIPSLFLLFCNRGKTHGHDLKGERGPSVREKPLPGTRQGLVIMPPQSSAGARRFRQCEECCQIFETAEVEAKVLDELAKLRTALADIKLNAAAYEVDAKKTAEKLNKLGGWLAVLNI